MQRGLPALSLRYSFGFLSSIFIADLKLVEIAAPLELTGAFTGIL
jgi:hypothetical protein